MVHQRLSQLCDTNVWLALLVRAHEHHEAAMAWMDSVQAQESILFCRSTQQSLLRILTQPGFTARYSLPAYTNEEAWRFYETTLSDDRVAFQVDEPVSLPEHWRKYSSLRTASPKLWMDAYLAAFARAAGHRFVTTDRAFRQFDGLDLLLLSSEP